MSDFDTIFADVDKQKKNSFDSTFAQIEQEKENEAWNMLAAEATIYEPFFDKIEAAELAERDMYGREELNLDKLNSLNLGREMRDYPDAPKSSFFGTVDDNTKKEFIREKRSQRDDLGYEMMPVDKKKLMEGGYDKEGKPVLNGPTVRAANSMYIAEATGMPPEQATILYDSLVKSIWGDKQPSDVKPLGKLVRKWYSDRKMIEKGIYPELYRAAQRYAAGDDTVNWDVVDENLSAEKRELFYSYIAQMGRPKQRGFFGKTAEVLKRSVSTTGKALGNYMPLVNADKSVEQPLEWMAIFNEFEAREGREPTQEESVALMEQATVRMKDRILNREKRKQALDSGDPVKGESIPGKIYFGALSQTPNLLASAAIGAATKSKTASFSFWYMMTATDFYSDMRDLGFDDKTSTGTAKIMAMPIAAVEFLQANQLTKGLTSEAKKKAVAKAQQGFMNYLGGKLKSGLATYGEQLSEEVIQSGLGIGGKVMAASLTEDAPEINWWDDVISPELEGLKEAGWSLLGLSGGGTMIQAGGEMRMVSKIMKEYPGIDKKTARAAVYNLKSGAFEEMDKQGVEYIPYTPQQIADETEKTTQKIEAFEAAGIKDGELYEYNMKRLEILENGGDRAALARLEQNFGIKEDFNEEQETEQTQEQTSGTMSQEYQQEVVKAASDILTANGITAQIKAVENIDLPQNMNDDQKAAAQGARGAFYLDGDGSKVIQLAFAFNENHNAADITTAGHESFHALKSLLTAEEDSAIASEYGSSEEAQAEGFGKWLAESYQKSNTADQSLTERAFNKILEVLNRIWTALKGQGLTYQDVFSGIQKGQLKGRGSAAGGQQASFQMGKNKTAMVNADSDLIANIKKAHKNNADIKQILKELGSYGMETEQSAKEKAMQKLLDQAGKQYSKDMDVQKLLGQLTERVQKDKKKDIIKGGWVNTAKRKIISRYPHMLSEIDATINSAINQGYLDMLEELARPGAQTKINKIKELIANFKNPDTRKDTTVSSYWLFSQYGTVNIALDRILKDVSILRGVNIPAISNISEKTVKQRKDATGMVKDWPNIVDQSGNVEAWEPAADAGKLPYVDMSELKGGNLGGKAPNKWLGSTYMRRPPTGQAKSPLLTETVKWYADLIIEQGDTDLDIEARQQYSQIKEQANEQGQMDFWADVYEQMPEYREQLGQIWDNAAQSVHEILSKQQMEDGGQVLSKIKSYPKWSEIEKTFASQKQDKSAVPVTSDKYDRSGMKLLIPDKYNAQLKSMGKSELYVKNAIVEFDYQTPDDALIQDTQRAKQDLGEQEYAEQTAKGKKPRIISSVVCDRDSRRFRITVFSPEATKSGVLAHERGHVRLRVIRDTMPETFERIKTWRQVCVEDGADPTQSFEEAFSDEIEIAESGNVSTLPEWLLDEIYSVDEKGLSDEQFGKIARSWDEPLKGPEVFEADPQVKFQLNDPFAKEIDKYLDGKLKSNENLKLGYTPTVLRMLGAKDLQLTVAQDVIDKVLSPSKHELTAELLKELPYQLWRPMMVFESATTPNSFVVMTELVHGNEHVVAAVHLEKRQDRHVVNKIASVYPKSDKGIAGWVEEGLLKYVDSQKSLDWFQLIGVQFPKRGANQGSNTDIRFKGDLVKYEGQKKSDQVKFQIDTAPMSALDKDFQRDAESYIGDIFPEGPDRVNAFIQETRDRAGGISSIDDRNDAMAEIDAAKAAADEMYAANSAAASAKKGQIRATKDAAKTAGENAIKAAVAAKAAVDKALYYQESRPEKIGLRERFANKTYGFIKDAKKMGGFLAVPMASRLEDISPTVFQQVLYTEYKVKMRTAAMVRQAAPLLEKLNKFAKLDKSKYEDFAKAWRDGDFTEAQRIAQRYGFADEFTDAKAVLDSIFAMANAVGMEVRYAEGYGPRHIVDMDGFMKAIGGTDVHSRLKEAIKQQVKQKGRQLEKDEELRIINSLIRGYSVSGITLGRPGHAKERGVTDTGGELSRFYADPQKALMHYITEMNEKITWREFFGRETKEMVNLRAQKSRLLTRLNALSGKTKGKVFMMGKGWQEMNDVDYSQHISDVKKQLEEVREKIIAADKFVLSESIAKYIEDQYLRPSEIAGSPGKYGEDLGRILQAIIEPKAVSDRTLKALRDIGYVTTLANPFSAMTQLKDLGVTAYRDIYNVLPQALKAAVNNGEIKLEDIGVEMFGEELAADSVGKAVKATMELSGFAYVDRLGKTTYINTVVNKYRRQAQDISNTDIAQMQAGTKKKAEVFERIERFFGQRTGEVIRQLQSGGITEDIKFLAFAELADVQPLAMSAMPEGYARAGNLRLAYMMKSFTIRQINWIYREAIKEMGNKNTFARGAKRFTQLAVTLMAFNIGVEVLKDMAKGRPPEPEDITDAAIDEIMGYLLMSRYTMNKVKRDGLNALIFQGVPVTKPVDWIVQRRPDKAVRNIPIMGEPFYWWMVADN